MPPFSERIGITQPKALQINNIDQDLRNSLWNISSAYLFSFNTHYLSHDNVLNAKAILLYRDFYKQPVDELPETSRGFIREMKTNMLEDEWHNVLSMIEFLIQRCRVSNECIDEINFVMERERSAYRLVDRLFAPITNEDEITAIETAVAQSGRFAAVSAHVKRAIELFAEKPTPDYRNTVKEAISAVEAAARIIAGKPNADLNAAIRNIEQRHSLHPAFRAGIEKFYSYTSDEKGVRHALTEDGSNVDEADALFMLVSCSAFSNYLVSRFNKAAPA